jgi:hypothetical protein
VEVVQVADVEEEDDKDDEDVEEVEVLREVGGAVSLEEMKRSSKTRSPTSCSLSSMLWMGS